MIDLVKAVQVRALTDYRLDLRFSDGSSGVVDLRDFVFAGGTVVKPLQDAAFFARVFLEMGAPTWPNGCDIDPTAARMELAKEGRLQMANIVA